MLGSWSFERDRWSQKPGARSWDSWRIIFYQYAAPIVLGESGGGPPHSKTLPRGSTRPANAKRLGLRWVRVGGTHRFGRWGKSRLPSSTARVGSNRKRCQPCSPPAAAVQDAGANVTDLEPRGASWNAPALWRFGRRRGNWLDQRQRRNRAAFTAPRPRQMSVPKRRWTRTYYQNRVAP